MNKMLINWFQRYLFHPEAISLLAIFVFSLFLFKTVGQVLAPIIISIILAYSLASVVRRLERLHLPHLLAVSIVFSLFILILMLLLLWLLPIFWEQTVSLLNEFPLMFGRIQALLAKLQAKFPEIISAGQLQQVAGYVINYIGNFGKVVVSFSITSLFSIVSVIVYLVLVPFLIFFFLRDSEVILNWFVSLLPRNRSVLESVWNDLRSKIRCYVQGKFIEIVVVALVSIVAFELLGLRYAVLLGALVGFSVVIPYIGVVVVTVPIVIVGLVQWGWTEHFFYLMLIYTIICILDANILVPMLFSEVMNLHPLAIILSVLLFGNLFGFWGVFFAIPLMTLIVIVIKSWPRQSLN